MNLAVGYGDGFGVGCGGLCDGDTDEQHPCRTPLGLHAGSMDALSTPLGFDISDVHGFDSRVVRCRRGDGDGNVVTVYIMEVAMKLQDIGNMDTFGVRLNRMVRVGNWSYLDQQSGWYYDRNIFHHGTLMGAIVRKADGWDFQPVSTGWGSVSDQGGMNKIIRNFGWYYSRKGGEAEYIRR